MRVRSVNRVLVILLLALTVHMSIKAKDFPALQIEAVQITDLGISERDDTKSVIEVRWLVNPAAQANVIFFNLTLSIIYADGTTATIKKQIDASFIAIRVEVPSVKLSSGRPPAFIKRMNAVVVAVGPQPKV